MKHKHLIKPLLLLIILLYGMQTTAYSYVLNAPHIIDLMVSNMGNVKSAYITQTLLLYPDNHTQSTTELTETVKYDFPMAFRSDIASAQIQRIHLASDGNVCTMLDGKIVASDSQRPNNGFDIYKDILLMRSRTLFQQHLDSLGVDTAISSIGRFQNRIFYIVGAQYPDAQPMQLWVDRETLRPVRWIIQGKHEARSENAYEIRYLEWRRFGENSKINFWHPMRIRFFLNDRLTREIIVKNIKINPVFAKTVFDIAHLKSLYPYNNSKRMNLGKTSEIDEVQKTIHDFQRLYQ
ncbi:hypothetical protein QUF75_01270 [Desulfococcaceae bacterium HSG7]|nr:hypothetical protein [Desulfococcaceae bacterium HSG7]